MNAYIKPFFFIMIALCSCVTQRCERKLSSAIKKGWHYNPDTKCYSADPQFIASLDSGLYKCFIGKDTAYLGRFFGSNYEFTVNIPGERRRESLPFGVQYSTAPCVEKGRNKTCYFYQFYVDKQGIVRKSGRYEQRSSWID